MDSSMFEGRSVSKILLKLAPPVMLAQLIQALYNIVDSLFVGRYSESGLTALSIIYPVQLLMIAIAVGSGVGINTLMAHYMGVKDDKKADRVAGVAWPLGIALWAIFAILAYFFIPVFARISTNDENIIKDVIKYGRITSVFSIGLFLESLFSKILQARGNMRLPMIAQIVGAIINIVLDPILIFGYLGLPELGIAGAAIATVVGQIGAMIIVAIKASEKSPTIKKYPKILKDVYHLGYPNILMQAAYTFYIFGLNQILKGFSDDAVTALGLYYKWQTFFFIPLGALQTCIVPILSYNYARGDISMCKKTLNTTLFYGLCLMMIGVICFEAIPRPMLRCFSKNENVLDIASFGFRIIGISFIPMVTSLIYPVFFQAVANSIKSSFLTILRTIILFVPLGFLFSRFGLHYFWLTFPITEVITSIVGFMLYKAFLKKEEGKLLVENSNGNMV